MFGAPTPASAEELRVAVVGTGYVSTTDLDELRRIQTEMTRGMESQIRGMSQFSLVPFESLQLAVRTRASYQESLKLAESWAEMGITKYRELNAVGAIQSLEQSVNIYRSVGFDLTDPIAFSQVLMYLALSHLEGQQDVVRPLELMQEMIRLNPTLVMLEGFYPQNVVQLYESARLTLERSVRDNGPGLARGARIAEYTQADLVLFADRVEGQNGPVVVMHLFDTRNSTFTRDIHPVATENHADATSRLTSRFLSCLLPAEEVAPPLVESKGLSPWSVHLNFAYAWFLTFPDPKVELFGHYGAAFGIGYSVTREFAILASMQVLTSMRDYSGFLSDDFTTLRGFGGVELGYSFGLFRAEIGTTVEASTVGDIFVCENVNFIPRGCDAEHTTQYSFGFLLGANVRPKVALQLLPSLSTHIAASGSFYVYPLSQRRLNFPLTLETGLQYRF